MALTFTSYTELEASVADELNRTDLTAQIPGFITLAEAVIARRLRTRRMVGRSNASLTGEYIALPDDFGGPRAMVLTGTVPKISLKYVAPETAMELQTQYQTSGQPKVYTVVGEEFQFLPPPDGTYTLELTYWKRLAALSVSNTSNWVLEDHPDLYLYGACLQAAPYLIDDPRLNMWGSLFEAAISGIKEEETQADYASRLNARPAVSF